MLQEAWVAAAVGIAVAGVSALIAWFALRWSARRPGTMMIAVLGGTMVRLLLVVGVSILLLLFKEVHIAGYATGLICAYLVFLGLEIVLVLRSADRKGHASDVGGGVDKRGG